jgi:hypothetical protein
MLAQVMLNAQNDYYGKWLFFHIKTGCSTWTLHQTPKNNGFKPIYSLLKGS